jgi:hypothetical protein
MPKPDKLSQAVMKANQRAVKGSKISATGAGTKAPRPTITRAQGRPSGAIYGGKAASKGK